MCVGGGGGGMCVGVCVWGGAIGVCVWGGGGVCDLFYWGRTFISQFLLLFFNYL